MKAGPEVGMYTVGTDGGAGAGKECALGTGESGGFGQVAQEGLVEHLHEFGAAGVIYFPQGGQ